MGKVTKIIYFTKKGIKEMCEDSWRWQSNNPNGYEEYELDEVALSKM